MAALRTFHRGYCCEWKHMGGVDIAGHLEARLVGRCSSSPSGHVYTAYRQLYRDVRSFRAADVLLCSGPLWTCLAWRRVTQKPMLAVSFTFVGLYHERSGVHMDEIRRRVRRGTQKLPPR
eukprot:3620660-Amphidinium_carterae.1